MILYYILDCNPLVEDYLHAYSRIRFYSDTIVKFCEALKVEGIKIVYPGTTEKYSERIYYKKEHTESLFNLSKNCFDNCSYFQDRLVELGIGVEFCPIEEVKDINKEDIAIFGICTFNTGVAFYNTLQKIATIINEVDHYYYLESDDPTAQSYFLGNFNFIKQFNTLKNLNGFESFSSKLKKVVITETANPNALSAFEQYGITKDKIAYLPIVIDTKNRILHNKEKNNLVSNKIFVLSNLFSWLSKQEYFELFTKYKEYFDLYDLEFAVSSLEKFYNDKGLSFKTSKFYTLEEMAKQLSNYNYLFGAGHPNNQRFTYKIVEATDTNTFCILPFVTVKPYLELNDYYKISQSIIDKYDILIDNMNEDFINRIANNKMVFRELIELQEQFVNEYFDRDSDHINKLFEIIIGE